MKYAVESKSLGRVLDMRDEAYSDESLKALCEAYGVDDLVVHEGVDTSVLHEKDCPVVKIEGGRLVEDAEASAEAAHDKATATIVELYKTRAAMAAAIKDGLALEDELAAVDARIKEVKGDLAELVARKVADAGFFTRLLAYLGLR